MIFWKITPAFQCSSWCQVKVSHCELDCSVWPGIPEIELRPWQKQREAKVWRQMLLNTSWCLMDVLWTDACVWHECDCECPTTTRAKQATKRRKKKKNLCLSRMRHDSTFLLLVENIGLDKVYFRNWVFISNLLILGFNLPQKWASNSKNWQRYGILKYGVLSRPQSAQHRAPCPCPSLP